MASIEVRGKEQLARVADVLTGHAEAKTIRRRLSSTIKDQASDVTDDQRKSVAEKMPKRGGLAATLEGQGRFTVRTALSGRGVGVTIMDGWKGHNVPALDNGTARHPLFGNRKHWYDTTVPSGAWSGQVGPRRRLLLAAAITRELDTLAAEIAKET